jgi:hypothetical protein
MSLDAVAVAAALDDAAAGAIVCGELAQSTQRERESERASERARERVR